MCARVYEDEKGATEEKLERRTGQKRKEEEEYKSEEKNRRKIEIWAWKRVVASTNYMGTMSCASVHAAFRRDTWM